MAVDALRRFCGWIAARMVTRPGLYSLCGLIVVVGLGIIYADLQPRYHLADQVPDKEKAVQANRALDAKLTGAQPVDVLIEFPKGQSLYSPETLATIAEVHSIVEKQAGVGNVWSLETLRRWLAQKVGKSDVATLKPICRLSAEISGRAVHLEQTRTPWSSKAGCPISIPARLLPVVDALDKNLNAVRAAHPGYEIAVTGLAVIAAHNSAGMIEKLNRGLTIEIVFVAAFIGLAFRSFSVMLASHHAGSLPGLHRRRRAVGAGPGAAIRQRRGADRILRPRPQRDDPLPQPIAARGQARGRSGHRRRTGDNPRRPGADPDLDRARLRPGDDDLLAIAVAAALRLAELFRDADSADRRPFHSAADDHAAFALEPEPALELSRPGGAVLIADAC